MVNRIWTNALADKADSVSSVSASACHIGEPNSVNPGQILLVYGKYFLEKSSTAGNFSAAMFMSYKDCSARLFEMYRQFVFNWLDQIFL